MNATVLRLRSQLVIAALLGTACSKNSFTGTGKDKDKQAGRPRASAPPSAPAPKAAEADASATKAAGATSVTPKSDDKVATVEMSETERLLRQDPKSIPLGVDDFCAKAIPRVGDACFYRLQKFTAKTCPELCQEQLKSEVHPLNAKIHSDEKLCSAVTYITNKFLDNYMVFQDPKEWVNKPEYGAVIVNPGETLKYITINNGTAQVSGACMETTLLTKVVGTSSGTPLPKGATTISNYLGRFYFVPPSSTSQNMDVNGPVKYADDFYPICTCQKK